MNFRRIYRITVFVPVDSAAAVKRALAESGELRHANYADVIFTSAPGTEQFRALDGANPTLGEIGTLTEAPSLKLVFSIARDAARLETVLEAITRSHPWEEPVIYIDECNALSR
jgi:hypothetical protein